MNLSGFTLLISKQGLIVALDGGFGPFLGYELPLVQGLWIDIGMLLDVLHEVVAEVLVGGDDDALDEVVVGNAGTFGEVLPSSIASIGIDGYFIVLVEVERCTVGHALNLHLLSCGLGGIDGIDDACC